MPTPRLRAVAVAASLLVLGACSSTSSRSVTSEGSSTISSLAGDTTTSSTLVGDTTTTAAGATTVAPTTPVTAPATTPATTPATSKPTTPPTAAPTGPRVTSFSITLSGTCTTTTLAPDVSYTTLPPPPAVVKISWKATGADSVYVAVDNKEGPYYQDLPLQGSTEINFSCGGSHTYWVVALKGPLSGGQKDYKSKVISG